MKVIIQSFILISFSILFSCEKEVIPKPVNSLAEEQAPLFYISGNFNGDEQLKVVGVDNYTAVTNSEIMDDSFGETIKFWAFQILNDSIPDIVIIIYTENNNYEDLVSATDSTHIEMLNPAASNPASFFYNRMEINLQEDRQIFSSGLIANSSLVVKKSIDTIVDNKQYRILDLEGDISLKEIQFNTPYQINNFKARVAFSY